MFPQFSEVKRRLQSEAEWNIYRVTVAPLRSRILCYAEASWNPRKYASAAIRNHSTERKAALLGGRIQTLMDLWRMTWMTKAKLEPGAEFVGAVLVAEGFFEDALFIADALELHGNQEQKQQKQIPRAEIHEQRREQYPVEEVNGAANFGVEAARHELMGFRAKGKGMAELRARQRPQAVRRNADGQAGDLMPLPRAAVSEMDQRGTDEAHDDGPKPCAPDSHTMSTKILNTRAKGRMLPVKKTDRYLAASARCPSRNNCSGPLSNR